MTGYELRIWRAGMGWTQEQAANALEFSVRTYKSYELKDKGRAPVPQILFQATRAISLEAMLPELSALTKEQILYRLSLILEEGHGSQDGARCALEPTAAASLPGSEAQAR